MNGMVLIQRNINTNIQTIHELFHHASELHAIIHEMTPTTNVRVCKTEKGMIYVCSNEI